MNKHNVDNWFGPDARNRCTPEMLDPKPADFRDYRSKRCRLSFILPGPSDVRSDQLDAIFRCVTPRLAVVRDALRHFFAV